MGAQFIDDRGGIILLLGRREPFAFIENNLVLVLSQGCRLPFLRLRDRRDKLSSSPLREYLLCWLAARVQFPMPPGTLVGRVENRVVEKGVGHRKTSAPLTAGLTWSNRTAWLLVICKRLSSVRIRWVYYRHAPLPGLVMWTWPLFCAGAGTGRLQRIAYRSSLPSDVMGHLFFRRAGVRAVSIS